MAGLSLNRRRALEIVILYLATRPDGLDDVLERIVRHITTHPIEFNAYLSQLYFGGASVPDEQNMFFPDDVWDMLTDTAQHIVSHLTAVRDDAP